MNIPNLVESVREILPPGELSMVPEKYHGWLHDRPDILEGRYSEERSGRDLKGQQDSLIHYLEYTSESFPQYADLVISVLEDPHSESPLYEVAGVREIRRRSIESMDPSCRIAICIPAKGEEGQIYSALTTYSVQQNLDGSPMDPRTYEFNVLVNTNTKDPLDRTYDEVARMKENYPFLRINILEIVFDNEWARVGMARKLLTDITLERANRAGLQAPLYLHSDDADVIWADPKHLAKAIDTLDKQPDLDAVVGFQEKFLRLLSEVEFSFMQQRVWDMIIVQASHYLHSGELPPEKRNFEHSRVYTFGTGTTYSAATLADIGGYDWNSKVAEDLDLGKRISLYRGKRAANGVFVPNVETVKMINTRTNTSPRRYVHGLYKSVEHIYNDVAFENQEVRELSLAEMMGDIPDRYKRLTMDSKRFYEKELWHQYYELRQMIPDQDVTRSIMSRSLMYLFDEGDVEVTEEEVHILNTESFSRKLSEYRESQGVPSTELDNYVGRNTRECEDELNRRRTLFI